MSFIEFQNVSKSYGEVSVLSSFNLQIQKGQFVTLLGPSGCGKTTTLRMLAGLERNTGGKIRLEQQILSSPEENTFVPPEKRQFGMVFQSYAVWPHMNVFENVAFPLQIKGLKKEEIRDQVHEILKIVELDHLSARMPNQLSGGQQQRVALARGLVVRPKALLMDEPLSNLDAKLREKMRTDIKRLQQKFALTVVFVTHDQLEAKSMSDLIVVMNKGAIAQMGTVEDIYRNPANEFVRDFIS
jgi:iron(III) transport system ATP-binding protein